MPEPDQKLQNGLEVFTINEEIRVKLKAKSWRTDSTAGFPDLSTEETGIIELRPAPGRALKETASQHETNAGKICREAPVGSKLAKI